MALNVFTSQNHIKSYQLNPH